MTHKVEKCKKCGKKWNVSILRDTSKGYTCPVCSWKEKNKEGRK